MSPHFGKVSEKFNERMKSSKAKVRFGQFGAFAGLFGPLLGPWDTSRVFCDNNFFDGAQLDMKIQLGAKFQEK